MANKEGGKLKLLHIVDILREYTDEEHSITTNELIKHLQEFGDSSERKSIYRDLEILEYYGLDIENNKKGQISLYSREFELSELKLLVDAVSACKFINKTEAQTLVEKIMKLGSYHQRQQLRRQVVVTERAREKSGSYFVIDEIHRCIEGDCKMTFTYFQWNEKKRLVPLHKGKVYKVSPCFLVWDHEYYYLVAIDEDGGRLKHYRVDKIQDAALVDERRSKEVKKVNRKDYTSKRFGMFDGETMHVTMRAPKQMAGVFIDRFGTGVIIHVDGEDILVTTEITISRQFFGWLTGLGPSVVLESPVEVAEQYKKEVKQILKNYK